MSLKGYPALACGMLFLMTSIYCWHILGSFHPSVVWRWGQEEELCFLSLRWWVAVQSPHMTWQGQITLWKRERGCLLTTVLLLKPLRTITPLCWKSLDTHGCRRPAVGTGLEGRLFPLCQAPDSAASMSTVSGSPLSPFCSYSPSLLSSSWSPDWELVAPPLTDTRVTAVCTGAVWERGQAWGAEMLLVATPPVCCAGSSSCTPPLLADKHYRNVPSQSCWVSV